MTITVVKSNNKFDINTTTQDAQKAIERDDPSALGRIDLNSPLLNGEHPLQYAVRCKAYTVVKKMLEEIESTEIRDHNGLNPLDHATIIKDEQMCALLLGHRVAQTLKSDQMKANPTFVSNLKNALSNEINKRRNTSFSDNEHVQSIHSIAYKGDLKALKQFKDHLINLKDKDGLTPLHYAAMSGEADVIEWLLEKGCNPNLLTRDGKSALTYAAMAGKPSIVELLLKKSQKGTLNHADKNGYTPLHYAAVADSLATSKLLVEHGADPLLSSPDGKAPITVMLEIAKDRENSKDPLALSTLEKITFAGIVIPWAVHLTGLSSLSFLGTLTNFFLAAAAFLKHPIDSILLYTFSSLIIRTSGALPFRIYTTLLSASVAIEGLNKSWGDLSLETYRPIRNAVVRTINGLGSSISMWKTANAVSTQRLKIEEIQKLQKDLLKPCIDFDATDTCKNKSIVDCLSSKKILPHCPSHASFILNQSGKKWTEYNTKEAYNALREKIDLEMGQIATDLRISADLAEEKSTAAFNTIKQATRLNYPNKNSNIFSYNSDSTYNCKDKSIIDCINRKEINPKRLPDASFVLNQSGGDWRQHGLKISFSSLLAKINIVRIKAFIGKERLKLHLKKSVRQAKELIQVRAWRKDLESSFTNKLSQFLFPGSERKSQNNTA